MKMLLFNQFKEFLLEEAKAASTRLIDFRRFDI